eukprot:5807997-Pyramimonas_sp.AAC.1
MGGYTLFYCTQTPRPCPEVSALYACIVKEGREFQARQVQSAVQRSKQRSKTKLQRNAEHDSELDNLLGNADWIPL